MSQRTGRGVARVPSVDFSDHWSMAENSGDSGADGGDVAPPDPSQLKKQRILSGFIDQLGVDEDDSMPGSPVPARKTLSAEPLPEDAAVPAVGSQAAAHAETEAPGSGEALTDSRDFLYTRNLEREIKADLSKVVGQKLKARQRIRSQSLSESNSAEPLEKMVRERSGFRGVAKYLDTEGQCGEVFYNRMDVDITEVAGFDDSETVVAKGMLQAIRLRRRYMEQSCQTVPPHVEAAVNQVTRLRRETSTESIDQKSWERAGFSPARPTFPRDESAESLAQTATEMTSSVTHSSSSSRVASPTSLGAPRNLFGPADGSAYATPGPAREFRCYNRSCPLSKSSADRATAEGDGSQGPTRMLHSPAVYAATSRCYSPTCRRYRASKRHTFAMRNGVCEVRKAAAAEQGRPLYRTINVNKYLTDMKGLIVLVTDGPTKSIAFRRCEFLRKKFQMHKLLNDTLETAAQRNVAHRDFYNVRKVDTHVHLSACMNQKHLLRFIKKKLKQEKRTIVAEAPCLDGTTRKMSLQEVFDSTGMTAHELNLDKLDMSAGQTTFHRFDRFNAKYNPMGSGKLREIFLKTANKLRAPPPKEQKSKERAGKEAAAAVRQPLTSGRYYAEVCREVFDDLEESKYQQAEYRVSVYGRSATEWFTLSQWFVQFNLDSPNVRWLIQTPRLFYLYASKGTLNNFEEMLENFFLPLFKASDDPEAYPDLTQFLERVVGFDSVDDESKPEHYPHSTDSPPPKEWTTGNPAYSYYLYYWYANMCILNQFRKDRGLNTFVFRPHCGESGSIDHLISSFLLAEGISHGINLRKAPTMQYLYYLTQIPQAVSPLSNNGLFLTLERNPFMQFFETGMNISLSTDDPLQFHMSKEPLIEEYSVATQVWKLNSTDQAELCANSVRMSGFDDHLKRKWLCEAWRMPGPKGNDIDKSNVPNVRLAFRYETLLLELQDHLFEHLKMD